MGDELLDVDDADRRFRWDKIITPSFQRTIVRTATLSFNPLSRDDEGQYECTNNIVSPYTTNSLTKVETAIITVIRKEEIKFCSICAFSL